MNKRAFIKKIKEIAQQDKRRRLDSRYLKVMGFLVAKGFLYTIGHTGILDTKYNS